MDGPGPFVVLVDLKRDKDMPRVWVVPSAEVSGYVASLDESEWWGYSLSAAELAPHEDDWNAIERHLLYPHAPRTGWFDREELEERYGEEFAEAVDAEASRLLGVENSTIRRMADARFSAEELARASALLSVLFRRWMEEKRHRRG